jgi:hypothetical protein
MKLRAGSPSLFQDGEHAVTFNSEHKYEHIQNYTRLGSTLVTEKH